MTGRDLVKSSVVLSENEMLDAIFEAIGALAYRLTGERLVIQVRDRNGSLSRIYSGSNAIWCETVQSCPSEADGVGADEAVSGHPCFVRRESLPSFPICSIYGMPL